MNDQKKKEKARRWEKWRGVCSTQSTETRKRKG